MQIVLIIAKLAIYVSLLNQLSVPCSSTITYTDVDGLYSVDSYEETDRCCSPISPIVVRQYTSTAKWRVGWLYSNTESCKNLGLVCYGFTADVIPTWTQTTWKATFEVEYQQYYWNENVTFILSKDQNGVVTGSIKISSEKFSCSYTLQSEPEGYLGDGCIIPDDSTAEASKAKESKSNVGLFAGLGVGGILIVILLCCVCHYISSTQCWQEAAKVAAIERKQDELRRKEQELQDRRSELYEIRNRIQNLT